MSQGAEPPGEINLSDERPTRTALKPRESDKPYDPAKDREVARARIAGGLLAGFFLLLLAYVIVAPLAGASFADLSPFFDKVFTGLIGLVGTALGFYFGSRER